MSNSLFCPRFNTIQFEYGIWYIDYSLVTQIERRVFSVFYKSILAIILFFLKNIFILTLKNFYDIFSRF